jgi:NAD+ synthase (glutamine-hydrolysing)
MTETRRLRIALAQVNSTVGDIEGNADLVVEWTGRAREASAQLVLFPELVLSGYPAEDLWLKRHFLDRVGEALHRVAAATDGIVAVVGFPERAAAIHNSAAVLCGGAVQAIYRKMLLPNYGVFDERRYFEAGTTPSVIEINGVTVGLTICEDIWFPGAPASIEALAGARLIVNPSASPYHRGKGIERERMVAERTAETGAAFAMSATVGGQDELVFDGHSVVVSADGETVARARQFEQDLLVCDLDLPAADAALAGVDDPGLDALPADAGATLLGRFEVPQHHGPPVEPRLAPVLGEEEEVYAALRLGLHDYVLKNGFERVLVAVSGGVDSALVAMIAVDALGPERVTGVVMPSPHSSEETQADARAIVRNLGAALIEIPIESAMEAYGDLLDLSYARPDADPAGPGGGSSIQSPRGSRGPGVREGAEEPAGIGSVAAENIQARIRGNLMMALSNQTGWLVLTTGNKSELSVGYATLYGDMAGGFAVIKDVPKTLVYRLVRHRNRVEGAELVPGSVLERPPSAELRPGQRDQDSLPPYELLDRILESYVEGDRGRDEIVADGLPGEVVDEVIAMVDRSEYKRRQAPPGIKITPKAFGRDRRLPITNRFRG